MAISNAVGSERVAKIVGYSLTAGNFAENSPNLPQRVAILAEANEANQSSLSTEPLQITSAKQAGDAYGYGSPAYLIARILFPTSGGGIGGIPVVVYPQAKASGATSKKYEITPAGTATANGTHTVVIGGRSFLDGGSYNFTVVSGDTATEITQKIEDVVNNVLGCPVTADSDGYVTELESKWRGATANDITVSIETNGDDLGITYAISSTQSGAGTPAVTPALEKFGNVWNTIVVNSYGLNTTVVSELENFNGIPSATNPTGRYDGITFKPFIALSGSVLNDNSSFTDTKKQQVTIAVCPAPLSKGLPMEAAANMAVLFGRQAQDNPHLDVSGSFYPDMPTPTAIGTMADYNTRDSFVKKGNSCVILLDGRYQVTDFVTTYHPDGEIPPAYRYCRNLMIDFNIRYGYYLLELTNVVDHAISDDKDTVSAGTVIKPKIWKGILATYAESLVLRGLIVQAAFMQDSIRVSISTTNPDRLETYYKYKRSGYTRIASTTAEAGFNFGTN